VVRRWFRQPEAGPPWAEKLNMYHYVYVLQNKNGELYKGSTDDLRKRKADHNGGKVKSTRKGRPWKLIYYEAFLSKKASKKEELFLKSGKGRERLKFLLNGT
jgi:putative endonuclease